MRAKLTIFLGVLAVLSISTTGWDQNPITMDSPFQIRYAANLNLGDSVINLTNSGANGASLDPAVRAGNICANVYTFSPDEQMVSCCSCLITPNALMNLSVQRDLISNTLTPAVPTGVTIKLLSTLAGTGGSGTTCNPATAGTAQPLAVGLLAWGTTVHGSTSTTTVPNTSATCIRYCTAPISSVYASYCAANCKSTTVTTTTLSTTETPFLPASLSAGELARIQDLCTDIQQNGSGFGICRSCRLGGL